jgi:predicted  nucleic acid-binding Zn-ribbon protein
MGTLLELQKIDTQLDQLNDNCESLLNEIHEDHGRLRQSTLLQDKEAVAVEINLRMENLISINVDNISRKQSLEKKLFSGNITNTKELSSLQSELDNIGTIIDDNELETFDLEDNIAELAIVIEQLQGSIIKLDKEKQIEVERLNPQVDSLRVQITKTELEKNKCNKDISSGLLTMYETLRLSKNRIAVCTINELQGACEICKITVPTSFLARLRANASVVTCPSCGRIASLK